MNWLFNQFKYGRWPSNSGVSDAADWQEEWWGIFDQPSKYIGGFSCPGYGQLQRRCDQFSVWLKDSELGTPPGTMGVWGAVTMIAVTDPSTGSVQWACSPAAKGATSPVVPIKYMPSSCRTLVP